MLINDTTHTAMLIENEDYEEIILASDSTVERILLVNMPGFFNEFINSILKPKVSWSEHLRLFVQSARAYKSTWIPPNRRHIWNKLYLPGYKGESLNACIAVDSSGSISTELLEQFFSEIKFITEQFAKHKLNIAVFDTEIHNTFEITSDDFSDILTDIKITGRGDTDFIPVFKYFNEMEEVHFLIVFTDGYAPYPEEQPHYPVCWGIPKDRHIAVSWGKVVKIEE